ncbi:hypothetical protein HZA96_05290 [Candidatus Woesearchaeota archaeon]|nr:hypothetical protein [Candidatus Woesearchaeota archaeon]
MISKRELEIISERQTKKYLLDNDIVINQIAKQKKKRTADYKFNDDFHIETTIINGYIPKVINDYFDKYKNDFGEGIIVKVTAQKKKITIKKTEKFICDYNLFLLLLNISPMIFKSKIIYKLDDKYGQISNAKLGGIVVLDFRVAGIDLYQLSNLLKNILIHNGNNYPKLAGVLILSAKEPQSPKKIPEGILIKNSFYKYIIPSCFNSLSNKKTIEFQISPYLILANLNYTQIGVNEFKINLENIKLPNGKKLYLSGISEKAKGLIKIEVKNNM